MIRLHTLFLLIMCALQQSLQAQVHNDIFRTDSLLRSRGEAYISVPNNRLKAAKCIPKLLIHDKTTDSVSYFYVNRLAFDQLIKSEIEFFYVTPPSLAYNIKMAESTQQVFDIEGYPTYQQYLEIMNNFRISYPSLCKIDTIGYSKGGRLILTARLSTATHADGTKPFLMYSSTIHGDEPAGYILMILLIDELLKGYGLNAEYTGLLEESVISINPLSNPDGTYFTNDSTIFGSIRQNLNYADLNRSYPDWTQNDDPVSFNWQPENSAMDKYMRKYNPTLSVNFHGGAEVVNYPWDAIPGKHPDDTWYAYISKEYADTAKNTDPAYMSEFPGGITNGYAWYKINGGRMDYVNYYLKGREVTIELSNAKIPSPENLNYLWLINRRSLTNYLKQGLYGIWGAVTDSITGIPLKARIEIPGHDENSSFIYSGKTSGKFFRYLHEGNYSMMIKSDGYIAKNLEGIKVENNQRTNLSVGLLTLKSLIDDKNFLILPNPFNNKFSVLFTTVNSVDCHMLVYTADGIPVFENVFVSSPGINEIEIDLSSNKPGMYILYLLAGNKTIVKKVIKAA